MTNKTKNLEFDSFILADITLEKVKIELLKKENHRVAENEAEMFILGFCMGMQKYDSLLKNKHKVTKENNSETKRKEK